MDTAEIISMVLNLVLGGGFVVTLATLHAQRQKADAEADEVEIRNSKEILESQREYIVKPLKTEINALRKDVRRLQKALDKINTCPHYNNCPVRRELQSNPLDDIQPEPRET